MGARTQDHAADLTGQAARLYGLRLDAVGLTRLEIGIRSGTLRRVELGRGVLAAEWAGRWLAVGVDPETGRLLAFLPPVVLVQHRRAIEAGSSAPKTDPPRPRGKGPKPRPKSKPADPAAVLAGLPADPGPLPAVATEADCVACMAGVAARLAAVRQRSLDPRTGRSARRVLEREQVRLSQRRSEVRAARHALHKRARADALGTNPADPLDVLLGWYRAAGDSIRTGTFPASEHDARQAAEWCLRSHGRIA